MFMQTSSSFNNENPINRIQEFCTALQQEIEAIRRGRGGNTVTIYDGKLLKRLSDSSYTVLNLKTS